MKQIVVLVLTVLFSAQVLAKASLGNIRAYVDHDYEEFVTELSFDGKIDLSKIKIKHLDDKVVITLPEIKTEKEKANLKIKDSEVSSIGVVKNKKDVNIQVNFVGGIDAKNFKGYSRVEKDGKLVRLSLKRHSYIAQQNKMRKELLQPVSLGADNESKQPAEEVKPQKIVDLDEAPEEEIPVLTQAEVKTKKAEGDSLLSRLAMSLGLIVSFAIGLFFFVRWWSKNYKTQDMQSKIRVLTQHHIGPKKTLAIIRVAGEAILIGITDHSINHIKTLSLLDGDVPEDVPVNFKNELNANFQDEESEQEEVVDTFSYGENIKKTITSRLKGMRR